MNELVEIIEGGTPTKVHVHGYMHKTTEQKVVLTKTSEHMHPTVGKFCLHIATGNNASGAYVRPEDLIEALKVMGFLER